MPGEQGTGSARRFLIVDLAGVITIESGSGSVCGLLVLVKSADMEMMEQVDIQQQLEKTFSGYVGRREELIPLLQDIQEGLGYIPREAMQQVAMFLNIPASSVFGVLTFYTQFYLTPQGKHRIRVCQGTACHVRGGPEIVRAIRKKLGIGPGETTTDRRFTLERVACLGSCALAPAMVVNETVYGKLTPEQALEILEEYP